LPSAHLILARQANPPHRRLTAFEACGAFNGRRSSEFPSLPGSSVASRIQAIWWGMKCFESLDSESSRRLADFFTQLLEKNQLSIADPHRGRFRNFLLGSVTHFLANDWKHAHRLKRGGVCDFVSLSDESVAEPLATSQDITPEAAFDRGRQLRQL
jgi:RNA polymerase sigma-70 factor (ECF subfamily)